mmetsp:Transcript_9710/g.13363  ORF Transcript_9710/g.13363 Transcript_9710/m.13363 type:complete len:349 (+) Transcript_9710:1536-2582(+)
MVVHRVFKHIVISRIPRGHGHLDPDSKFGMISRAGHGRTLYTPQQYQGFLGKVFSKGETNFSLVNILVLPDYVKLLEDCVDPELKLLKEINTNHQWFFDAVDRTSRYPLTSYRTYSENEVFEIVEHIDPTNPLCIGLEPWLTHVRTFPEDTEPPIHTLIDLPINKILVHGFKEGGVQSIETAAENFSRSFPSQADHKVDWNSFLETVPKSDFATQFVHESGILHVPLKNVLFGFCSIDTDTSVPPLESNKRTHDGKPIKERRTTSNVPHSNDTARKKPRIALNPADERDEIILSASDRADYIKNIAKLVVKKISKKQLVTLLTEVNLKTSGNKEDMLARLKGYYHNLN